MLGLILGIATALPGNQSPPVFRAEAYVITNQIVLLERGDQPVRGLTAANASIVVDKKIAVPFEVREHSEKPAHYLFSFNPPERLRDGKSHRIDVKIRSRDGKWRTLPLKWQATFVKPTSEAAAISAAKTAIVGTIEAKMPRVTFEAWLRDLVGDKPAITWEVNDCGEQTGSPVDRGRDTPICVEARVELAVNRQLGLLLAAGSNGRGLSTDPPAFYYGSLKGPGHPTSGFSRRSQRFPASLAALGVPGQMQSSSRHLIADWLTRLVARVRSIDGVRGAWTRF
jgi:hypothetical protein